MADLVAFLTARLNEEHGAAQVAYDEATDYRVTGGPVVEDHFTLWRPVRVLADVDAKRRIVKLHGRAEGPLWPTNDGYCDECGTGRVDWGPGASADFYPQLWPCTTLRLLALPYADHPDYNQDWKP